MQILFLNRFKLGLFLCLFTSFNIKANNLGKWISGTWGEDNLKSYSYNAWFPNNKAKDRTINYCYVYSPNFAVATEDIEKTIVRVFKKWNDYLVYRQIHRPEHNYRPQITHRLSKKEKCDGSEDLKFYFGIIDNKITSLMKKFENPTAFAHMISYDKENAWGKGLIWIANSGSVSPDISYPDWSNLLKFNAIMLHQVGHVFGNGHRKNTIMTDEISTILKLKNDYNYSYTNPGIEFEAMFTEIDHKRSLVTCDVSFILCKKVEGVLRHLTPVRYPDLFGSPRQRLEEQVQNNFQRLIGTKPVGEVKVFLERHADNPGAGFPAYHLLDLKISDEEKEYIKTIKISLSSAFIEGVDENYNEMFRVLLKDHLSFILPANKGYRGTITACNGQKIEIQLLINVGGFVMWDYTNFGAATSEYMIIARFGDGKWRTIFSNIVKANTQI